MSDKRTEAMDLLACIYNANKPADEIGEHEIMSALRLVTSWGVSLSEAAQLIALADEHPEIAGTVQSAQQLERACDRLRRHIRDQAKVSQRQHGRQEPRPFQPYDVAPGGIAHKSPPAPERTAAASAERPYTGDPLESMFLCTPTMTAEQRLHHMAWRQEWIDLIREGERAGHRGARLMDWVLRERQRRRPDFRIGRLRGVARALEQGKPAAIGDIIAPAPRVQEWDEQRESPIYADAFEDFDEIPY